MSDTPIRRQPPPKLDRVLATYERRARLIAQLHEQAIKKANDLSAQHKAIRADIAKDARRLHELNSQSLPPGPGCNPPVRVFSD